MNSAVPAFGICGWSGSGKTTLILELIRIFAGRGLKVAVIKHDVHGLDADREGKDSDRFFRAGADVLLFGPGEGLGRFQLPNPVSVDAEVNRLDGEYDLILVEGNKSAKLARKVWLARKESETFPADIPGVARVLAPDEDRVGIVKAMVEDWLRQRPAATPTCAGILFGGRSRRMGQPKHLMQFQDRTWLEHIAATIEPFVQQVVLLGAGEVPGSLRGLPVLPDVPDKEGPIAGMLAAMRWNPHAGWLFAACDLPRISPEAVEWLVQQRGPGILAVLPRLAGAEAVEPLFAFYEDRARPLLEGVSGPSALARLRAVISPELPSEIAHAWGNMNTPLDLAGLEKMP